MAIPQGVNSLVGSSSDYVAAGGSEGFGDFDPVVPSARRNSLFAGNGTDGTEVLVGAIVLAALLALILFRVGGFQAVIAS